MREIVRIGTRGSPLALAQTKLVVHLLSAHFHDTDFQTKTIRTRGDMLPVPRGSGVDLKKVFTKEIEDELSMSRIDMAVHSLKDLPSDRGEELIIGAVPIREDPRDVLVLKSGTTLDELPSGSKIGTSSLRRRAQILNRRPDLQVEDLHGNIGTRIKKIETAGLDGVILAAAGLIRLGLQKNITEYLPYDLILPAPGQGALAIQIRSDDSRVLRIVQKINDTTSYATTDAERAFSTALGGDCDAPVAAYGEANGEKMTLRGMVATPTGARIVRASLGGDLRESKVLGERLAERILNDGGKEILEEVTRSQD